MGPNGSRPTGGGSRRWKFVFGVVVLAVIPVVILYLSRPPDPHTSARGAADAIAKSITNGDDAGFRRYLCPGSTDDLDAAINAKLWRDVGVLGVSSGSDDSAVATLTLGRQSDHDLAMSLVKKNGQWCTAADQVCVVEKQPTAAGDLPPLDLCHHRPGRPSS